MTPDNRNAAIAAPVIVPGFGTGAFCLPTIMLAIGSYSPVIAGIFGVLTPVRSKPVPYLRADFLKWPHCRQRTTTMLRHPHGASFYGGTAFAAVPGAPLTIG